MTIPTWGHRCTIGGVATAIKSGSIAFDRANPVGVCSLVPATTDAVPLAAQIDAGAAVQVDFATDGVYWPVFTGTMGTPDRSTTTQGRRATLAPEGVLRKASFALNRAKAFTGGAKVGPTSLFTTAKHLGTQTLSWYANHAPNGNTSGGKVHEVTFTPSADSHFVWITLDVHGSNSYDTDIGDKTIRDSSRIEIWQNGVKLGYANLPESSENWTDEDDYTVKANWDEDVEIFIGAHIVLADGDVTVKFIAGHKPGSSAYDELELDDATLQTAGRHKLREIVRGTLKLCGLTTAQYDISEITDLDGNTILLGGNGLVDNGQVVLAADERPLDFLSRLLALFGYALFDCPDGIVRVRAIRGMPSGTADVTFTEGVNILGLATVVQNPKPVNAVALDGASGNNQNGVAFAYTYATADVDIIPNPLIPDDGTAWARGLGGNELVSDALCQQAGKIAEVNLGDSWTVSLDARPVALRPGQVIRVISATHGVDRKFWVTSVRYTFDGSGYRMSVSGWTGTSAPFGEASDPNPSETDTVPSDARPVSEWRPLTALARAA